MPLPKMINPLALAKAGEQISGSCNLSQMQRVEELVGDGIEGQITFLFEFFHDQQYQLFCIKGKIEARMNLTCQRCLEPMPLVVDSVISMAIITDDNRVGQLPKQYEPYLNKGKSVSLRELLEDELLLAMPMAPMHEECLADGNQHT